MEKKLIIVSAPPASGKTYVSMKIAESLEHVTYLDKDSLVPLSNVAYKIAGIPVEREGEFFHKNIRDVEYDVILEMAFTALNYEDIVLINAPFTSEIHHPEYIANLRKKLKEKYNAHLVIVWVVCDIQTVKENTKQFKSSVKGDFFLYLFVLSCDCSFFSLSIYFSYSF